jgi:hypothetical protein
MDKSKEVNLIELNEINFDYLKKYTSDDEDKYPGISKLLKLNEYRTKAEDRYHLLEPWIQWASVNTQLEYSEHKIYRLGDINTYRGEQIFREIEKLGYSVGCLSPMNAVNDLSNPSYFVPDPWTNTKPDKSILSKLLHKALVQAVNDNSKARITFSTLFTLAMSFILFSRKKNLPLYVALFKRRKKRWNKALFLDLFLSDIFTSHYLKKRASLNVLFLNSFAHVQHHYFLNSKKYVGGVKNDPVYIDPDDDPIEDAIKVFDRIIGQLMDQTRGDIIFATGLQQVPVKETVVYYRLRRHAEFLDKIGIKYKNLHPRMTRDFLIEFADEEQLNIAHEKLVSLHYNGNLLFSEIECRTLSLFVTLTFNKELTGSEKIELSQNVITLADEFVFVANKNGEHDGTGYVFTSIDCKYLKHREPVHVKNLGSEILNYFRRDSSI